jgi:protoporphyrinogen oxidase
MKSTRSGANQKEEAGHLIGGFNTLIQTMVNRIVAGGGKIHLQKAVDKIIIDQNKAQGILLDGEIHRFDRLVSTLQPPLFQSLIPETNREYQDLLRQTSFLGIICPLIVLDRPLTGYWTLNLTDDRIPFTGVIETTAYIDPQYVGGHHLVYLPKYTSPDSPYQKMTDEEVKELWLNQLEMMIPDFDRDWIRYFLVQREKYVEPLHPLNGTSLIPPVQTPIKNLYLATSAQIYPTLTNGESISRKAKEIAELIVAEK